MPSIKTEKHRVQILRHLRKYGHISLKTAIEKYNCMRLAARICELRNQFAATGEARITNLSPRGQRAVYKYEKL